MCDSAGLNIFSFHLHLIDCHFRNVAYLLLLLRFQISSRLLSDAELLSVSPNHETNSVYTTVTTNTTMQILKLEQRVLQRNCEIIPIRMFFSEKNFVKIELGVGTKKTMGDKRDGEMKKEGERDIRRTMKGGSYD